MSLSRLQSINFTADSELNFNHAVHLSDILLAIMIGLASFWADEKSSLL